MRVRFAPSPTGNLHIGGARTALYNWLLARGSGGAFVLRIEDTDRERSTPENVEQIIDALTWLGLDWDEGPHSQAARAAEHRAAIDQMLASGHAYEDDGAVRIKVPDEGEAVVRDVIRGDVTFPLSAIDDFVVARSDGSALYNLAVAVDDRDMGITHVVRGEDHLSNTPRQILVARALGVASPRFAHLPLLVAPGGAPLSKREGAVSVRALRDAGYPPEAVLNHLALLGWSPPGGVEVLTREELVAAFDLARVSRSPAVFDRQKLDAIAMRHLQRWDPVRLAAEAAPVLQEAGLLPERLTGDVTAWSESVVGLVSDRLSRLGELPGLLGVVFGFDLETSLRDEDVRGTLGDSRGRQVVSETLGLLEEEPLTAPRLQTIVAEVRRRTGAKGKDLFHPIRVGLTGFSSGPELVRLLPVLDAGSRLDLPRPVPGCADRARSLLAATKKA